MEFLDVGKWEVFANKIADRCVIYKCPLDGIIASLAETKSLSEIQEECLRRELVLRNDYYGAWFGEGVRRQSQDIILTIECKTGISRQDSGMFCGSLLIKDKVPPPLYSMEERIVDEIIGRWFSVNLSF